MKARVIQIQTNEPARIAQLMELSINDFLAQKPGANVHSTPISVLDIGGASQADLIVLCTIFYSEG
jgi:hypothetical protein